MKKLIKISEKHYVIVDDSIDIEENCYCYKNGKIHQVSFLGQDNGDTITHSTEPLEEVKSIYNVEAKEIEKGIFSKIKHIPLLEVEELINGYNVEKLADAYCKLWEWERILGTGSNGLAYDSFVQGFNIHKELTKDKLFTIEDIKKAFTQGKFEGVNMYMVEDRDYIQSLQQTEWNIAIDEQGKIKLIKELEK